MLLPARKTLFIGAGLLLACAIAARVGQSAEAPAKTKPVAKRAATETAKGTAPPENFFVDEVWAKVAAQSCIKCHKAGGDAEESKLVLLDPEKSLGTAAQADALKHNRDAFFTVARQKEKDESRLLLKVAGKLDHGGEAVLKPDSTGYKILAELVRRVNIPQSRAELEAQSLAANDAPFFAGVKMLDDRQLLRRITLSLNGRLPAKEELAAVDKDGLKAMPGIMDALMNEEAFYLRLREGFNDIFQTLGGYEDVPEGLLSYRYFHKTRLWYQKHDLSHIADKEERKQAGYKLTRQYREALVDEPARLVEYIVRNDRPFTEIVTADFIMVSPYSSRAYGVFEEVKPKFKNPDDPFEYVPVRLKALIGNQPQDKQESPTGYYPHAGVLSTFQYLTKYGTTETNRNRLRTRMYYEHFLGVDLLELAARVSDAAEVSKHYKVPTMEAADCVVCHRTMDPVAGLFQDYYDLQGTFGRRKEGWYTDMFQAGFEGESLPKEERWRALQWLGERTAKDPRFAVAMVEHVHYVLTGRKPLLPPKDLQDPLFAARRRAYLEQRRTIEKIALDFSKTGFNLKDVFKQLVLSDFYRADGLATAALEPQRAAELDDVGLVRLLSPEQIERKIKAVFGQPWGKLKDEWAMLYGGIDYKQVSERAADPSGALGAIQRILSNDVAAKNTLRDFARPAAERRLFPGIEPDVVPGASPEGDLKIRQAIVHLHELLLGRYDAADSVEVDRTFKLFAGIISDAKAKKSFDSVEIYHIRHEIPKAPADPKYTIRAWRGVVTYLLRRQEFLYE